MSIRNKVFFIIYRLASIVSQSGEHMSVFVTRPKFINSPPVLSASIFVATKSWNEMKFGLKNS